MGNLVIIFVELNEGKKDYVSGYVYRNGKLVAQLDDINKPWDVDDYTQAWKIGLWNEYKRRAIAQGIISDNDAVIFN